MALRMPGKGNFKPVRPTIRRPPAALAPSSQPTKAARPTIVTSSDPQVAVPSASAPAATTTSTQTPSSSQQQSQPENDGASATPIASDTPAVLEAVLPPGLLPSAVLTSDPKTADSDDTRNDREDSVFSVPPTPSAASPSPATTPRGPRKAKPLLAAAAASKTPTQRGTLREREKQKQQARAEREKLVDQSSFRFTPTPRHSPAPGTPTASAWGPPTVATATQDGTQTTKSPTATLTQSSDMWPPTVEASSSAADAYATGLAASLPPIPTAAAAAAMSDFPPVVAPTEALADSSRSTPDPAVLAAALVASIKPAPPGRKRQVGNKASPDTDNTPATSPKRRRTGRQGTVDTVATDDADDADSEDGKPSRGARGRYGTRGRAGTTADRRTSAFRRQSAIAQPELDGVAVNDLVGEEVNESVMKMGDLATSLAAQGRVSARTIKLANFQRGEDERKLKERAIRTEKNWRRRQIVRRKARELRNNKREDRREAARAGGDNPDDVSADEIDSDVDFEIEPDRLTPPGSPRGPERIAPVRFEPAAEGEGENEEGADGAAPKRAENPAGMEDIEGLGFVDQQTEAGDEENGEIIEDFQLPVEEDPAGEGVNDFSGLEYNDYTGGYLDDEGNWVEGGATQAAAIHQRNEERRRRIMDGDHGQQVEVIDNETTFINSATWGKKVNNDRWTSEETELFFAVLRETGENYTLMKAYFPGRTVRQLKNKGSRENRVNPQRMTDAIMNRKPMDKEYLAKSSGFNIEKPYDRENAFLDEVAREKDRVVAGLLPFGEEIDVGEIDVDAQTGSWEANALEFAVQA